MQKTRTEKEREMKAAREAIEKQCSTAMNLGMLVGTIFGFLLCALFVLVGKL